MPRSSCRTLWVLLLTLVFASGAVAQTTGSIRGQIRDYEGNPLPGVTVTVTNTERGTSRTNVTGDTGHFAVPSLGVGVYDVTARIEGFQEQTVNGVRVGISSSVTLDLSMELTTIEEAIVVSGAPILEVTSSSVGTNYSADFIKELPTTRNFWDMMAVSPGISQDSEQGTGMSAFGSGVSSNSWSIDGLDTTNADTGNAWWWINPDTIEEVQVLAIGAPAQYGNMSGAAFNVVTKSGTNDFKGAANLYYQDDSLTSENAKIDGIPFRRDKYSDFTLSLGGPVVRDRWWFFGSYQNYQEGSTEPGEDPNFPSDNWSHRIDLKVDGQLTDSTSLNVKGHFEDWDFAWSDPYYTKDASGSWSGDNPAWGIEVNSILTPNSFLEARVSGYSGDENYLSRTRSREDPFEDRSVNPNLNSGGFKYPYRWDILRNQADVTLSTHADDFLKGDHEFKFGVSYGVGEGDTVTAGGVNGVYYYKGYEYYSYYYYQYLNYYYRYFSDAYHYGAETATLSAFIDDSWKVTENLTINVGVRYDSISSDIPSYPRLGMDWQPTGETVPGIKNAVEWDHFSPRIGFAYRTGNRGVLRGFYGKFYDGNVTGNWYAPPPDPPIWTLEYALSPDGPWIPWSTFEWHANTINPDLKPPETDQFTLGYEYQIGADYTVGVQGVYKETDNLIGWEILGDGVYEMVPWTNPFTGEVTELASIIEQPTTQKGNRPGEGSLAPPGESFNQDYKGAFVTFNKRYSNGWTMMASYTWSDSTGFLPKPTSEVQGDPLYTGTDGRDPNNWINAKQALQNEREHVVQVQGSWDLPWKLTGTAIYRYLAGKPYNRQLSVGGIGGGATLNQGAQTVIAIPAESGTTRPATNVLDAGLARDFELGKVDLGVNIKLLNVFNDDSHDWWQDLKVPPGSEFVPKGYILPRRWMLQLRVRF